MVSSDNSRPAPDRRFRGRRGIALLSVLWVLTLLTLMAVTFARTTRTEINLAHNLLENAKAEALADAGVHQAIYAVIANKGEPVLSAELDELIQRRPEIGDALPKRPEVQDMLRDQAVAQTEQGTWRRDGTVYVWPHLDAVLRVSIQDEGGKIDLNSARDELLRGLLLAAQWERADGEPTGLDVSQADALVDAIRDFADEDDLTHLNGAEDKDYAAAGLAWDAKDGPFEAVEELQQVLGMTPLLYEQIRPALTVHNGGRGIDPGVAPRAVLLALPKITEDQVDGYLAARARETEGAGPSLLLAKGFAQRSRGRFLTIRSEAQTPSGAVFVREALIVVTRTPAQPFAIRVWKQGTRDDLR